MALSQELDELLDQIDLKLMEAEKLAPQTPQDSPCEPPIDQTHRKLQSSREDWSVAVRNFQVEAQVLKPVLDVTVPGQEAKKINLK